MCYGDGNLASTFDTYSGDITYSSLTLTPAEFEVTSGSGELLEVCVYIIIFNIIFLFNIY
jgi:hypothetical protein